MQIASLAGNVGLSFSEKNVDRVQNTIVTTLFSSHTQFAITKLLGSGCNTSRIECFLFQLCKMCCRPKDNLLKTKKTKPNTGTGGSAGNCLK